MSLNGGRIYGYKKKNVSCTCFLVVISFTPCTVTIVTMTSELQSRKDYVITILGSGPLMVIPNVPEGWMAL